MACLNFSGRREWDPEHARRVHYLAARQLDEVIDRTGEEIRISSPVTLVTQVQKTLQVVCFTVAPSQAILASVHAMTGSDISVSED